MKSASCRKKINLFDKLLSKTILLAVLLVFVWSGLTVIDHTWAFFNDIKIGKPSNIAAGNLDLSLDKTDLGEMVLGEETTFLASSAGTLSFQYQFKVETEDNDFCADLSLTAVLGAEMFSGPLKNFFSTTTVIADLGDEWQLTITDPADNPLGQTCLINIIFHAWQIDQKFYHPTFGFSDVELVTGTVASGNGVGGPDCLQLTEPNGGEVWWVGRLHKMAWFTTEPNGVDNDLLIDLYYSNNSGQSWGLIKKDAPNNGAYIWRVSLLLENNSYWVPSDTARVKAVAHYSNGKICGWDMSDEDYCPPIEYDLLTPEERSWLLAHNLIDEGSSTPPAAPADAAPAPENGFPDETVTEEIITANSVTELGSATEEIGSEIVEEIEETKEDINTEEIINEEIPEPIISIEQIELPPLATQIAEAVATGDIIIGEILMEENNLLALPEPATWPITEPISRAEEILAEPPIIKEIMEETVMKDHMNALENNSADSRELEIIINNEVISLEVNEI